MTSKQEKIDQLEEFSRRWLAKAIDLANTDLRLESHSDAQIFDMAVESTIAMLASSINMLKTNFEYLMTHQKDLQSDLEKEIAHLKAENSKLVSDAGWTADLHRQQLDAVSGDTWK